MNFINELTWRGLIQNCSDLSAAEKLTNYSFYCGFDPTAPSLQIGNLVPILSMIHIAKDGLKPIVLLGGATGAIGDPSGKNAERSLLEQKVIEENVSKQHQQFLNLFFKIGIKPTFVNNKDWFANISFIDFLRDVGKHFTIGYMLQKDSVKSRLEGEGLSYTEFSYMLLQAYDFLHLYKNNNCRLHVGGSDQWGNITAGLELIRRKGLEGACALTFPLITNSQGKKLGKSESGTLWLDPSATSPFRFHQYFLNVEDGDAVRFLKLLTFLDSKKISTLEESLKNEPEKREAQKALADELCTFVHGESATDTAKKSASVLFGGSVSGLKSAELIDIFADVPSTEVGENSLFGTIAIDLFVTTKLAKSKGEAKRLIESGGAYINNERLTDPAVTLTKDHIIDGKLLILRSGKKNYHLVRQLQ